MLISIIIPALNEASCIENTLNALSCQAQPFEVVLADGGSSDATVDIAAAHARIVIADRGRASQMNAGAAVARGDIFLFLHADTSLPPGGLDSIRQAVDQKAEAGIFRLQFDLDTPLLRFYSLCTRLNYSRICFGDRALFVKRSTFEELGGFPVIPVFEDLEMVRKLHRRGRFVFLDEAVVTAARRFESKGPLKQQLLNSYLWCRYLMGASPLDLAHYYSYPESLEGCR